MSPRALCGRLPWRAISLLGVGIAAGCAGRFVAGRPPDGGFDGAIVLGCPNDAGGGISPCQADRAAWAAELWRRGAVRWFITSGAAVHTPWVEAETLAQAMVQLGVPADRIYLERDAYHTDENVYNSMRIAEAVGLRSLVLVSSAGHAGWACRMARAWGRECGTLPIDAQAVGADRGRHGPLLAALRFARVPEREWRPLAERERARAAERGTTVRPPSYLLYPYVALGGLFGAVWTPASPREVSRVTWAERLADGAPIADR